MATTCRPSTRGRRSTKRSRLRLAVRVATIGTALVGGGLVEALDASLARDFMSRAGSGPDSAGMTCECQLSVCGREGHEVISREETGERPCPSRCSLPTAHHDRAGCAMRARPLSIDGELRPSLHGGITGSFGPRRPGVRESTRGARDGARLSDERGAARSISCWFRRFLPIRRSDQRQFGVLNRRGIAFPGSLHRSGPAPRTCKAGQRGRLKTRCSRD
jgi:hypothetical protein